MEKSTATKTRQCRNCAYHERKGKPNEVSIARGTSRDESRLRGKIYLINPRTFFGRRATSASEIPKLSAISDAGFADSHLDIEISSNPGLLNRMTSLATFRRKIARSE